MTRKQPSSRVSREHHVHASPRLRYGLLTVSDTRREEDDTAGDGIVALLAAAKQDVVARKWAPDEVDELRSALESLLANAEVDVVITTGGTGVSPRDVTPEAVAPILTKPLPGFGEALRRLSWESVGAAAIASRALAGIAARAAGAKLVFCLPGSPDACSLALDQLILPEAGHLHAQANRPHGEGPDGG